MHASVRAMLTQIIDYAGLFPPAKLPLDDALNQYLHARMHSPYSWMLGRFVCPTASLPELSMLEQVHVDAFALRVTALGQQVSKAVEFLPQLQRDIQSIADYRTAAGFPTENLNYEITLPMKEAIEQIISAMPAAANELSLAEVRGFFEIPLSATWRHDIDQLCRFRAAMQPDFWAFGLKLRCGGLTADAFPSDEQIAFFIARCNEAQIPWKATAGLHHPRRHFDKALQVWHHGFLNVFGAGLLAWSNPLTEADLVAILADRDCERFRFEDSRISWGDWSCTTEQIAAGRADFATSFGSCSFAEPCDDLIAMGLLDAISEPEA